MIFDCSTEMGSSIFYQSHPYIHVHHWETEKVFREQGWVETELCCHSCHKSLKVQYKHYSDIPMDGFEVLRDIADSFIKQHNSCKHRNFQNFCPSIRFETETLDLRNLNLLKLEGCNV